MKKIYIVLFVLAFCLSSLNAAETKCDTIVEKANPKCSKILKSTGNVIKSTGQKVDGLFEGMKKFSRKNKTIGQSLGIEKKKRRSLKEFSKDHKTINDTIKILEKK